MHRKTSAILIPGASAPAGINTIKSLKLSDFSGKIVSTDSNPLSAGFYMSEYCEVLPEITDIKYLDVLLEIIKKYKISILMPSSGHDIFPFSENKKKLKKLGVDAIVSERQVLEICRDKLLTYKHLKSQFNLPFTSSDPEDFSRFPLIAKPRFGKGSRDIIKVNNRSEAKFIKSRYEDMIYQEYLPGEEYTIDVLCDLQGNPIISVPRIRIQTKSGISTKGRIEMNKELIELSFNLVRNLKIIGPSCIQVKRGSDNEFKLVEINPRLGGGTMFTTLAGANFPQMIVDIVEGKELVTPKITEITVLRYYEEIILDKNNKRLIHSGKDMLTNDIYRP